MLQQYKRGLLTKRKLMMQQPQPAQLHKLQNKKNKKNSNPRHTLEVRLS
jgi:hypothetical protein